MSIKDFNEIIFSYLENDSKDNKSQVEKVLSKIFEKTFNTTSSGLSGKQLQIKNSCLEYCFSSIPSFVEQYHSDSIAHIDGVTDYDDAYIYFISETDKGTTFYFDLPELEVSQTY